MLSFASDYTGGRPRGDIFLQKLAETNRGESAGYGMDRYCQSAARKIQEATGCPEAEVYFLVGGNPTNAVVISSILAPYEGVVAAQTGHEYIMKPGRSEATGHKVLQLPEKMGRLIRRICRNICKISRRTQTMIIWYFPNGVSFPSDGIRNLIQPEGAAGDLGDLLFV